jgi:hypothetical protein
MSDRYRVPDGVGTYMSDSEDEGESKPRRDRADHSRRPKIEAERGEEPEDENAMDTG